MKCIEVHKLGTQRARDGQNGKYERWEGAFGRMDRWEKAEYESKHEKLILSLPRPYAIQTTGETDEGGFHLGVCRAVLPGGNYRAKVAGRWQLRYKSGVPASTCSHSSLGYTGPR